MSKKSMVERNKKRIWLTSRYRDRRALLKSKIMDKASEPEERFDAQLRLSELPRNSAKGRVRLRCLLTGRGRGNYRKFQLSRIALRELGATGKIPGMVKSSW
jgi:small subunit ribosomal protein S14